MSVSGEAFRSSRRYSIKASSVCCSASVSIALDIQDSYIGGCFVCYSVSDFGLIVIAIIKFDFTL